LPAAYLGWTPGVVGILVGLLLTVSVSLVTAPGATENRTAYTVSGVEGD
jgi:SSS family solute:Na+ symporter